MTDIGAWDIGGISPQWIESADWNSYPTVTLHCVAQVIDEIPARWEIHDLFEVACNPSNVNRKPLMNGGECLALAPNCSKVSINDGMYQWYGVVLYPKFREDSVSLDLIEWDITLELQDNTKTLLIEDPREESP